MSAFPGSFPSPYLRYAKIFCATLFVIYVIQAVSPLRLNTDASRLLTMAVSKYNGEGFLVEGKVDQFPIGYPWIVEGLLRTGLASSFTLCVLNLVFLATGLWVLRSWCQWTAISTELAVALVLSSWVMAKFVAIPLTELPYFAVSSLSIYCACLFSKQSGRNKWWSCLASFFLAMIATQCRTVGLTLFPALLLTTVLHMDHSMILSHIRSQFKTLAFVTISVVIPISVIAFLLIQRTEWYATQFSLKQSYFQSLLADANRNGFGKYLSRNIFYRLSEFGQLFCNVPLAKTPGTRQVFYVCGGFLWMWVVRGAWALAKNRTMLPVSLYFLSYSALMLFWPYFSVRFWLPMLSVLVVLVVSGAPERSVSSRFLKYALPLWALCYFSLGVVAIAYTTRLSLSGKNFSEVYGDGSMKMTYRFAFRNGQPVEMSKVQCRHLKLLRVFEPLAGGGLRIGSAPAVTGRLGHVEGDPCD